MVLNIKIAFKNWMITNLLMVNLALNFFYFGKLFSYDFGRIHLFKNCMKSVLFSIGDLVGLPKFALKPFFNLTSMKTDPLKF